MENPSIQRGANNANVARIQQADQAIRSGIANATQGVKQYSRAAVDTLQAGGNAAWSRARNVPSALSGAFNATRANMSTERSAASVAARTACMVGAAVGVVGAAGLILGNLPIEVAAGVLLQDLFILGAVASLAGLAITELLHAIGVGRSATAAADTPAARAHARDAKNEAAAASSDMAATTSQAAHQAGHGAEAAAEGVKEAN